MNRLLIANIMRIIKSKLFWLLCGIMTAVSLIIVLNAVADADKQIDNAMCFFVIPAEIAASVFISIFFGTEYGDGTMRNKLIIGHDRRSIYLANLITSAACALALVAFYMLPVTLIGFTAVGVPSGTSFAITAAGIITLLAFCSLFTMVSMIYANKAGATVINLALAFLLLFAAVLICTSLVAPEFQPSYGMDGEMEYVRNPHYVGGVKRIIMQFLADVLPSGQALQFTMGVSGPLWALPLYSSCVCIICAAIGMVVFYKKDIK